MTPFRKWVSSNLPKKTNNPNPSPTGKTRFGLYWFGASGDTELFEKASNINGFQGGRVANNLYISPFRATVFKTAALFLYLNSSVVIRVRKPLFSPLRPPQAGGRGCFPMEHIREAKQRLFLLKSTLFKNRKERTFSQKYFRFFSRYLFKWIPIRYNISTNLTNSARCRHENERYAEAIRHLLPQIQIHRQGREHREPD